MYEVARIVAIELPVGIHVGFEIPAIIRRVKMVPGLHKPPMQATG